MTTDDPAAKDWKAAVDRDHATRAEVLEALTDLGMAYASQTVVLLRARRERDSLARRLAKRFQEQKRAQAIIEYALHLRMHGENAPGGDETWSQFDRMAERFLRGATSEAETEEGRAPDALFGRDAGPEWHHPGACSWPERPCTGHVTSYPPVQVPENAGKHPGESADIPAKPDTESLLARPPEADVPGKHYRDIGCRRMHCTIPEHFVGGILPASNP